jgi:hypothetical protein
LTLESSVVPCTVVEVRVPSGFERRHGNWDWVELLGALTTTRRDLVGASVGSELPVTVVDRLPPSASVVPPSTTWVGTSHTGPDRTVLAIGAAGAQGS